MEAELLSKILEKKTFKIVVKPNSKRNAVIKFDDARDAFIIEIKARAKNNKANIELIKFLSRLLKHRVEIVTGFGSKEKILKVI